MLDSPPFASHKPQHFTNLDPLPIRTYDFGKFFQNLQNHIDKIHQTDYNEIIKLDKNKSKGVTHEKQ